jgi:hypothetical protein
MLGLSHLLHYFYKINLASRNLVNVHETKISYNSTDLTDKPPESTSTEITTGTITDTRLYSPSVIKAAIDTLIAAGGDSSVLWKDINGMPPLFDIT